MKKALIVAALMASVCFGATAQAAESLPGGDPQETRYRKLLQRWNEKPEVAPGCHSDEARRAAFIKNLQKLPPDQQKPAALRAIAAKETWDAMSPAEKQKAREENLRAQRKAHESYVKNQKKAHERFLREQEKAGKTAKTQ